MADVHVNIELQYRQREQVLDQITNISPTDRPLLAALKRRDATSTKVEWTKDTLATPSAANHNAHGFTVTFAAADWAARTQDYNYTQLMKKQASVDRSHEAVEKAGLGRGPEAELTYQKGIKLDELLNDAEANLVSATTRVAPAPNSGTDGEAGGVQTFVQTNAINAGASPWTGVLDQSMYDDAAQKAWKKGGKPLSIYCGSQAKRAIAGWVTQVNRPVSDAGKKLVNVINQYETLVGLQDVILERNMTSVLLMIEDGRFEVAWLREPTWYDIGLVGDFKGGYYAAELCLVALAEESSAKITGLNYTV